MHISVDGKWYHRNEKAEHLREQEQFYYRVLAVKNDRQIHQSGVVSPGNISLYIKNQRTNGPVSLT